MRKKLIIIAFVSLFVIGLMTLFIINKDTNKYSSLINQYKHNKRINEDYYGEIYFDSGLINLPFVKGETNDTYLRTNWLNNKYDIGGSVFIDSNNDIEKDQNIIIYGHNFSDANPKRMFTPLRLLKEKDNYEDNEIINIFSKDKLYRYQIVSVYNVKVIEEDNKQYINDNEPLYILKNYTKEELYDYLIKVKEREYYDTGVSIDDNDKLLTLQTCLDDGVDKLIILSKLIEKIDIETK